MEMIAKLKGVIDTIGTDYLIIDVNGVGYLVYCSSKTLSRLSKGTPSSLLIETVVREDSFTLYGFSTALEKEWFNVLTKVQGVGAKVGLAILSTLSIPELSQAVMAQDKASFTRVSGIGPKLGARIVVELKDKIVTAPIQDISEMEEIVETSDIEVSPVQEQIITEDEANYNEINDAVSALTNLGYQKIEAYRVVNNVASKNSKAKMADLIKLSLSEFAKKDL
jgi:Holliday junction DNA helicase RuvA